MVKLILDGPRDPQRPRLPGWEAPVIYDVGSDQLRLVTQADVDLWFGMVQQYGLLKDANIKLSEALQKFEIKLKELGHAK